MPRYRKSEVATPRDIKLQIKQYVFLSGLFWGILSILGFILLLNLNIVGEIPINIYSGYSTVIQLFLIFITLFLVSCLWGVFLSLPAVLIILLAASSQTVSFGIRDTAASRFEALLAKWFKPFFCVFIHLLFLSLSFSTSPLFSRQYISFDNPISQYFRSMYVPFFSELSVDRTNLWQNAIKASENKLFVFSLPASILARPNAFAELLRELGEPSPFVVTENNLGANLERIFNNKTNVDNVINPPFPFFSQTNVYNEEQKTNFYLASENDLLIQTSSFAPKNMDKYVFLQHKVILSQPHLFLLLRLGLLSSLYPHLRWQNIIIDDSDRLKEFLDKIVLLGENKNIHYLQFSQLDKFFPISLAVRASKNITDIEKHALIHELDLYLSRGVALIKNNPNASIAIVPYPDSGSASPFSYGFFYLSKTLFADTNINKYLKQNILTTSDMHSIVYTHQTKKKLPISTSLFCEEMPINTGVFTKSPIEPTNDFLQKIFTTLNPIKENIYNIPPYALELSKQVSDIGALCRTSLAGMETQNILLRWKHATNEYHLPRNSRQPTLGELLVTQEVVNQNIKNKNSKKNGMQKQLAEEVVNLQNFSIEIENNIQAYNLYKENNSTSFILNPLITDKDFLIKYYPEFFRVFSQIIKGGQGK